MVQVDRSFVLLDAALEAGAALRRIELAPRAEWVVIRRADWGRVHWYTFRIEEARGRLAAKPATMSVKEALDLHEPNGVRLHAQGTLEGGALPGEVVMAAPGRPAGVVPRPRQKAKPPGTRKPTTRSFPAAEPPPAVGAEPGWAGAEPPMARGLDEAVRGPRASPPAGPVAGLPANGHGAPVPKNGHGAAAPPADVAPFQAWPDLQAPDFVVDHKSFPFEVGFAAAPDEKVVGGPVELAGAPPVLDLDLQISAAGFTSAKGWRHTLRVERDQPKKARLRLQLAAEAGALPAGQDTLQRVISVIFSYRGELCGVAQRPIVIVRQGAAVQAPPPGDPSAFSAQGPRGAPLRLGGHTAAPDLTVILTRTDGNAARSNFTWAFESPHDVAMPEPIHRDMEDDPATYARSLAAGVVKAADGGPTLLGLKIKGLGKKLAASVPTALWQAIAAVAPKVKPAGAPPAVLLLTEEWSIPWELAWMPAPLDRKVVGCLGAQVNLGRWLHDDQVPTARPATEVKVQRMVVLFGDYPKGAGALPDAIREKDTLVKREHAFAVPLVDDEVKSVLEGRTPRGGGQLLHFACHGVGDATQPGATHLVLQSGAELDGDVLGGGEVGPKHHPFLFLNACDAGTAGEELGLAGGLVGAALRAEFRGCVGALWSVSSGTAREVAEDFYDLTLRKGMPVAAALRQLRGRFRTGPGAKADDTWLAYVFYGHPALTLKRTGP